jgi:hypothetical protein
LSAPYGPSGRHSLSYDLPDSFGGSERTHKYKRAADGLCGPTLAFVRRVARLSSRSDVGRVLGRRTTAERVRGGLAQPCHPRRACGCASDRVARLMSRSDGGRVFGRRTNGRTSPGRTRSTVPPSQGVWDTRQDGWHGCARVSELGRVLGRPTTGELATARSAVPPLALRARGCHDATMAIP